MSPNTPACGLFKTLPGGVISSVSHVFRKGSEARWADSGAEVKEEQLVCALDALRPESR